eukprot:gene16777-19895_t
MPRGKGVKLQSYREGGLRDALVFAAEEGAGWTDSGGRRRDWNEWRDWLGKRAAAGKAAPKGFPAPASRTENFERRVLGLVGHLGAARDPVPEIDIRRAERSGLINVVQDDVGAEALRRKIGIVEAVDERQAIIEQVNENAGNEFARTLVVGASPVFDEVSADRCVLDHRHKIGPGHFRHPAVRVPCVEIATKQFELLGRRFGFNEVTLQIGV